MGSRLELLTVSQPSNRYDAFFRPCRSQISPRFAPGVGGSFTTSRPKNSPWSGYLKEPVWNLPRIRQVSVPLEWYGGSEHGNWCNMSPPRLMGHLPSGNLTELWKMAIYCGFSHQKWWFSIAMLNYQRVMRIYF